MTHSTIAGLIIWAFICALVIVVYWRAVLLLLTLVTLTVLLLGLAAILSLIAH